MAINKKQVGVLVAGVAAIASSAAASQGLAPAPPPRPRPRHRKHRGAGAGGGAVRPHVAERRGPADDRAGAAAVDRAPAGGFTPRGARSRSRSRLRGAARRSRPTTRRRRSATRPTSLTHRRRPRSRVQPGRRELGRLAARRAVRRVRPHPRTSRSPRSARSSTTSRATATTSSAARARRQRHHGDLRAEGHRRPDGRGGLGHQPGEDPARLGRGEQGGRARSRPRSSTSRPTATRSSRCSRAASTSRSARTRPPRTRPPCPGGLRSSARSTAAGPRPRRSPWAPSRATGSPAIPPRSTSVRGRHLHRGAGALGAEDEAIDQSETNPPGLPKSE